MPQIPKGDLEPRIDDLLDGAKLSIIAIGEDQTTAKGYDKITVTLLDGSEISGMGKAVVESLREARDTEGYEFGKDDPIECVVGKYESHGKTCTSLN